MVDSSQVVFILSDDTNARFQLRHLLAEQGLRATEFDTAAGYLSSSESDSPVCLILDFTRPDAKDLLVRVVRAARDLEKTMRLHRDATDRIRCHYALLTPRERQVFALVVDGLMNKQVASELGISDATVEIHRHRVMKKMRATSFAQLVRMSEALMSHEDASDALSTSLARDAARPLTAQRSASHD